MLLSVFVLLLLLELTISFHEVAIYVDQARRYVIDRLHSGKTIHAVVFNDFFDL